ncbi:unnamed protein product [Vitrella brassicaformis CCMP3155]|uniref:Uncharacterized protein n=1 Tax=Vitrella brassicaformis (strain CCMP3155) TaxID=1169540 RepID=A0A0G4F4Z4_VITBC|nr:unnamed protein product [Vitrella brassicaformis CCMP3155]|eukprot:CEM07007.1 unnamed protein product [Vitrella brassicaformis CCMP3155]
MRSRYLLSVKDVVRLRATSTWLVDLFDAAQLRDRLSHLVGSQAGLPRANVNGQQVQWLRFDDDQFGTHDLLAAVCVVEEGCWGEMAEVIELAGQCGNCELPVILTADDINTHANITAYVSAPRVLAQLKIVGRHLHCRDGSCLQLFRDGNQWRAINDEPGFELEVDPPLPADHLYQQQRQPHDPPVRSRNFYYWILRGGRRWTSFHGKFTDASLSAFAKDKILNHFHLTHLGQSNSTFTTLNRGIGGGRVDDLLSESPHRPVAGCSTTFSQDGRKRWLMLTNSSHPFVAWVEIRTLENNTGGTLGNNTDSGDGGGDEIDGVDDGSGEGDGGEGGAAEAESGG